ncbi:hypothetical protein SAMN05421882_1001145 [Nitrosomonas communis]|uniref:Uncharacterized protein n=1 Tax=Nitrosomonas communis TaxID=44574 RepID=A0A1H2Q0S6_9PROT|nr:hypothetical protein SAMN05421882_1001145 [Nitrosomonas communis]
MFQSSPSSLAGRYHCRTVKHHSVLMSFNPRPARWLGATTACISFARASDVSILAQLVGWALLFRSSRFMAMRCFNPRPARWLGATSGTEATIWEPGSFNPRPARWLGATAHRSHNRKTHKRFQSSPSSLAGRYALCEKR